MSRAPVHPGAGHTRSEKSVSVGTEASDSTTRPAAAAKVGWGIAPNFDAIPAELRGGLWCVWKAVPKGKAAAGAGKMDKVPHSPSRGHRISTAKPEQWGTFDEAVAAYQGGYNGIGRLVQLEDGLVFIDLDGALEDDRTVKPWAQEFLQLNTYAEISPSGTGLRLVVEDSIPADFSNNAAGVEMYAGHAPRFVTITGNTL